MPIDFSSMITAKTEGRGGFSIKNLELRELGEHASPLIVLHDFRVTGRPFAPHPHAGFSAVTYVFEDSQGSLRARDSLGSDALIEPGGICWTQAGSGLIHEETPADPSRELHGLQLFINLSAKNKLTDPRVFRLQSADVPQWRSNGDRVRVLVGWFEGLVSPLVPAEPFTMLEADLRHEISVDLKGGHNAIVWVLEGEVRVSAQSGGRTLARECAIGLHGSGRVRLEASKPAHILILSGEEIREPMIADGPFVMNQRSQIEAAFARYRTGAMGRLAPVSNS